MSFQVDAVRKQFPSLGQTLNGLPYTYFDGPGGTQVPESVIEAMANHYRTSNANAHGPFITSEQTDQLVDRARERFAAWVGAEDASSISFGANTTTLNFALSRAFGRLIQPGDEVIVTELDHEANVQPWAILEERGAVVKKIGVRPNGTLDMDEMRSVINARTRIVAVGLASNAIGTVTDVAAIGRWAHEAGAWMVVDAVHYAPHFKIDVKEFYPDFLLCSVYKFYGPHVGVLYSRPGLLDRLTTDRLPPAPSEAPGKIETGTMNFAALAGSVAAVDFVAGLGDASEESLEGRLSSAMKQIGAHEHALSQRLYNGLTAIEGVTVRGLPVEEGALRTPTVSFTMEQMSSPKVAEALGQQAIFVWGGHFYAPTLIEKLGTQPYGGVVRVGLSVYNTAQEVDRLLQAVESLAKGV